MGKNYVESSLKRFLKKRVRITLGLVVTFLITGVVTFSTSIEDHNNNLEGIITAKDNLTGINDPEKKFNDFSEKKVTINDHEYFIQMKDNTLSFRKGSDDAPEISSITIKNEDISNKLKTTIDNVLANLENADTSNSKINNVILTTGQSGNVTNNGIINSGGNYAQLANSNETIINNGIINTSGYYNQYIGNGKSNGTIINNGLIYANSGVGQLAAGSGKLINTGIIKASKQGQYLRTSETQAINYGIIETTTNIAQSNILENTKGSNDNVFLNYGIINSKSGQEMDGKASKAYNYGVISATSGGIKISGEAKGYNYGVVKVSDVSKAFSGDVTNKGIVIADYGSLEGKYTTGVLLDSNYNAVGKVKTFKSGETVTDFAGKNTFGKTATGEEITKGYVKNESVNIDNIQDKVVGAVVTEKLDKAVFNYSGDDLFLKDTSLVGYFETSGTLLDVGTGNLTLAGDTNITAVKNDLTLEDVYAVKLGDDATVTIADEAKINGLISGGKEITFANTKGNYTLADSGLVEVVVNDSTESKYLNYVDITLQSGKELTDKEDNEQTDKVESEIAGLKLSTGNTTEGLVNNVTVKEGLTIGKNAVDGKNYSIYDDNTNEKTELKMTVENLNDLEGDVLLGAGKDIFITNNKILKDKEKVVNLGAGEDTFIVKPGDTVQDQDGRTYGVFDYKVTNAETVELSGGQWTIGENANISFDHDGTKAGHTAMLKATDEATLNIVMNKGGSNLNNMIKNEGLLEKGDRLVIGTDEDSKIKYQIGMSGLPFTQEDTSYTADYGIAEDANVVAPIFNVTSDGKTTSISLKTAEQAGVANYAPVYNAYLKEVANKNWDVIKYINALNSDEALVKQIVDTDLNAEAYYTAGTVVTKNIADSYMSAVENFGRRAGKGEWIAEGKFINSDTEFDGGSKVKGYDGDINSAVGMIEYGVSENTSYGVALGGGDTEVNIKDGGKLDGDNYYIGAYVKHRTQNGFDLVGNFGIVKSDLDSELGNKFAFNVSGNEISGTTFEKGTADSTAAAISLKAKKDFYVTDSVKLQPVFGARMTLINQDKAENPAMNFEIKEQDVFVAEGILGGNVAKEFALSQGKLELNAGIEYTFGTSTENEDAEYRLFSDNHIKVENGEIASTIGNAHVGFDYEHENGVGFNGKYEMMWSDEGDDSRITAGVSYRF